MNELVSVVITTKNEEANIRNCLLSIREQSYQNIEIIVIDNHSTDKTAEIAYDFTQHVYQRGPERSAQRNEGLIVRAKGKYCIYLDADMVISNNLIAESVRQLKKGSYVGLYIPEIVVGKTFFSKVRRFERSFYTGTEIDAARFFSRETLIKVGGFDERLFVSGSGEDWDLDKAVRRLGEIGILGESQSSAKEDSHFYSNFASQNGVALPIGFNGILHNESQDRVIPYLKKKRYYSSGFDGYINKWGRNDPGIRKQFGLFYRFLIVFLENGKWRMSMRHPMLLVFTLALKVLVGIFVLGKFNIFRLRTSNK